MSSQEPATKTSLGRYTLHGEIASGGMATVFMGRVSGDAGFSRVVAIKRMLPKLARDPQFVAMFIDEATLASRILHPNVVPILDVVANGDGFFIVMDYVRGQSLNSLLRASIQRTSPVPVEIAAGVMIGVLTGLHAAHEARDKDGHLLSIVHRDVSPHNILVGADGVARIMDFGIAKASRQLHVTQAGQIKGKLSYMAPEQFRAEAMDRGADIFASGVVLWETLAGRRLFFSNDLEETMNQVLNAEIPSLAARRADVSTELDAVLAKALERDRSLRFATARDFARAIEQACPRIAGPGVIGEWVESLAADVLASRDEQASRAEVAIEASTSNDVVDPTTTVPTILRDEGGSTRRDEPVSEVQTIEMGSRHVDPKPSIAADETTIPEPAGVIEEANERANAAWIADKKRMSRMATGMVAVVALAGVALIGLTMVLFGHKKPPEAHRDLSTPPRDPIAETSEAPSALPSSGPPPAPTPLAVAPAIASIAPIAATASVAPAALSIALTPLRAAPHASVKVIARPPVPSQPSQPHSASDNPLLPERP